MYRPFASPVWRSPRVFPALAVLIMLGVMPAGLDATERVRAQAAAQETDRATSQAPAAERAASGARAWTGASPRASQGEDADRPRATATLKLEDVRAGMKGYGLTVFKGTTIEPFPIEVVSVMRQRGPKRGLIWIRCTGERLQKSGPAQGMSGSPIYVWPEGESGALGEGGKLIGAFAFGFAFGEDSFVGVQPIELMRGAGSHGAGAQEAEEAEEAEAAEAAEAADEAEAAKRRPARAEARDDQSLAAPREKAREKAREEAGGEAGGEATGGAIAARTLARVQAAMPDASDATLSRRKLELLQKALSTRSANVADSDRPAGAVDSGETNDPSDQGRRRRADFSQGPGLDAPPELSPFAATLPLIAPGVAQTPLTRDLLRLAGVSVRSTPSGGTVTAPPPGMTPEQAAAVRLEPGAALAVPLAWGDLDLSAVGTVTDVLPDGRVLGFGHAMTGRGAVALPAATGYVHFVHPSLNVSFKLSSSLNRRGAMVQDTQSGVVINPEASIDQTDVFVNVRRGDGPPERFKYHMAVDPGLSPVIAVMLLVSSVQAEQTLPPLNTVRMNVDMRFSEGRSLRFDFLKPSATIFDLLVEVLPTLTVLMDNPYKPLKPESLRFDVRIDPQVQQVRLLSATSDRPSYEPGDRVRLSLATQTYQGEPRRREVVFRLPRDAQPGEHQIIVADAATYFSFASAARQYRFQAQDIDDWLSVVREFLRIRPNAAYVLMPRAETTVAYGTHPLPDLPSSRRAVLEQGLSSRVMQTPSWKQMIVPTAHATEGSATVGITIKPRKIGRSR